MLSYHRGPTGAHPGTWMMTLHIGYTALLLCVPEPLIVHAAVPATICIRGNAKGMVEINFLCVHKKLRSKRLTPLLIKVIITSGDACNSCHMDSTCLFSRV